MSGKSKSSSFSLSRFGDSEQSICAPPQIQVNPSSTLVCLSGREDSKRTQLQTQMHRTLTTHIAILMHLSMSSPSGGGGGSGNLRDFDCGVYPQGGDFDRTLCILSFNFKE